MALSSVALFFVLALASESRVGPLPTPRPAPTMPQAQPSPGRLPFADIETRNVRGGGAAQPAPARADWLVYRDDANGIAFRYPPSLKVDVPALERPNGSGIVSIVQLWPADGSREGSAVLAILVQVCGDPMVACWDRVYRRDCHSFETFPVGNAHAFQCVDFGSAACHWSAHLDHKGRQILIQAPAAGYEINGRSRGREECAKGMTEIRSVDPIKAILSSFVFDN